MTILILQGRLDSSRLPGKSLLPLGGEPLIFRVMEALCRVPCDLRVLACPEDCEQSFGPLAVRAGFELCTGPRDDVLARFCIALRHYGPGGSCRVIRATGDNPFVFADAAGALAKEAAVRDADYAGYGELPLGAGVEAVRAEALFRAEAEASLPAEREHVCPYLYGRPELFSLYRPPAPSPWRKPDIRLTVDTAADYKNAQLLYEGLTGDHGDSDTRYRGETIIAAWERYCHPALGTP